MIKDRHPTSDVLADTARPDPDDLDRIRRILLGEHLRDLDELRARIDALGLSAEELAERLPEAIVLRSGEDQQLAQALAPTLDTAFAEAVRNNPDQITEAIFPILGPAIRKSITEALSSMVQAINRTIEHSLSPRGLRWRFEAWRTGVPYGEVVITHALVYRVEQIFLIHNDTGLLLAHAVAEGLDSQDADVISGMLTAIRDFMQDSFDTEAGDGFRRMSVGDHTVHAHQGPRAMIAAIVRGVPPESLDTRLQEINERIHLQLGGPLADFDGDTAAFDDTAMTILQPGLETVVQSDLPSRRRLGPRLAWSLMGIAVLVIAVVFVRGTLRWNRAVHALETTPGIVVTGADRSLRRLSLTGLADPGAPTPAVILAREGIDTTRIRATWEPFLSFHPAVVADRVRTTLRPPASVTFTVVDGRLVGTGTAPPEWIVESGKAAARVPGVTAVDFDGIGVELPPDLTRVRDDLAGIRMTFGVGSATLTPGATSTLDRVAGALRDIGERAAHRSLAAAVLIVGRADSTGTDRTNRRLSEQRATAVRNALVTRGVPPDLFAVEGLGTDDTDRAGGRARDPALNRSVTFALTFTLRRDST